MARSTRLTSRDRRSVIGATGSAGGRGEGRVPTPPSARLRAGLMRRPVPASGQVYVSVRDVAIRTGVSPRTVKRWIADGLLPATRLPSPKGLGQLRIRSSDLEVMMGRGTQL
jgi:excisionase family DNA binding protein